MESLGLVSADDQWRCMQVFIAKGAWQTMRGLIARPPLGPGEGLLVCSGSSIHTCGMGYSIDVVFLDKHFVVLGVRRSVVPWRFVRAPRRTRQVLELPQDASVGLEPGSILKTMTKTEAGR